MLASESFTVTDSGVVSLDRNLFSLYKRHPLTLKTKGYDLVQSKKEDRSKMQIKQRKVRTL